MSAKKLGFLQIIILSAVLAGCASAEIKPTEEVSTQVIQEESEVTETLMEQTQETESEDLGEFDITLCFAGDMSLADDAVTTAELAEQGEELSACISPELITYMQEADITCINNEFTFSTNGKPMEGKAYTFRSNPERVWVLKELGVDVVNLANNHVYDYGKTAFLDTMDTLEGADIDYFGAGENLEEAMSPVYYEIDGKTVAIVGASRAEKFKMTPQATEEKPGILRCYDTELFLEVIREADANADYVIAVVHWGTEYSYKLEAVQRSTGKDYLDAGADVIIGGHSHCLQGMEYYDGKPILYSLGNFWFNRKTLDTMLVQVRISGNKEESVLDVQIIPAIQSNNKTTYVEGEEAERIYSFLEDISVNASIDEEGFLHEQ